MNLLCKFYKKKEVSVKDIIETTKNVIDLFKIIFLLICILIVVTFLSTLIGFILFSERELTSFNILINGVLGTFTFISIIVTLSYLDNNWDEIINYKLAVCDEDCKRANAIKKMIEKKNEEEQ